MKKWRIWLPKNGKSGNGQQLVLQVFLGNFFRCVTYLHNLGRQLFERNRNLEDETLMEEGSTSVDISQYERTKAEEQEDEEDHVRFSDSD